MLSSFRDSTGRAETERICPGTGCHGRADIGPILVVLPAFIIGDQLEDWVYSDEAQSQLAQAEHEARTQDLPSSDDTEEVLKELKL